MGNECVPDHDKEIPWPAPDTLSFIVVGVSVDWKAEDEWEYLRSVGAFDE